MNKKFVEKKAIDERAIMENLKNWRCPRCCAGLGECTEFTTDDGKYAHEGFECEECGLKGEVEYEMELMDYTIEEE